MSASTNLCTRDRVKSYLGLTGDTYDDLIDALIPAASEALERACGRRFAETGYTEYHDGNGADRVVLNHRPVISLTAIWDDADRDFEAADLVDSDDYVLDAAAGIVILTSGRFARGARNVKVTYSAGYTTVPTDAAQACCMLVAAWFHRGREAADGLDRRAMAEVSQHFAVEAMPPVVSRLIASFREPHV